MPRTFVTGGPVGNGSHPDLAEHDALGLATQAELDAIGGHPNLAAHDALGLATDAALTAHEAAANPHPTYETAAEAQAKVDTHAGAADPHGGYQRESEKAAANGYAPLDSGLLVPRANLGTGTPDATKFLRGDGSWQVPPAGGGNDPRITTLTLANDQADITGTGLVEIAGLTVAGLAAGTYRFCYEMIYQTTATTTGVEFVVDHSGTVDRFVSTEVFGSTGGAAATGIADQQGVGSAAGLMEVKTARAKNTRPGVTIGVDTANADCLMTVEGVFRASTSGNLRILGAAELAALVMRVRAASSLVLVRTSP